MRSVRDFLKLDQLKNKRVYGVALVLFGIFATALILSAATEQQNNRSNAQAAGKIIVVAQDGSGDYTTIQTGLDAATPGDTVSVKAGTYKEAVIFRNNGASGSYITLKGEPGAIIDGTGSTARGLITFDGRSFIIINGMTVKNAGGHGMYGGGAINNIVIQDNEVDTSKDGGIFVGDGTNVTIIGNKVHGVNGGASGGVINNAANEGITLYKITNFDISKNQVYGNYEEGIDVKNGTNGGVVANNTVYDNNGPNIYADGANNVKIYANTVYGARGATKAGIVCAVESGGTSKDLFIYNNLIYNNKGGGIDCWTGHYSNVQIYNNTIYNNTRGGILATSGVVTNSVVRNNIIFNNTNNTVIGSGFTASNNLFTDPSFVNATNNDFHLMAGSAAIDAGVSEGAPATDFDGNARPVGSAVDIGAYEFGSEPIGTTAPTASAAPTSTPTATPTPLPTNTPVPTAIPTTAPSALLQNGSFEGSLVPWRFLVRSPANATAAVTTANKQSGQSSAVITISNAGTTTYGLQFRQDNITLTAGKTYTVSFWARASANRTVESVLQGPDSPYTIYKAQVVNLTTAWKQFSYTYRPTVATPIFFGFNVGTNKGTVWLDSVSLTSN